MSLIHIVLATLAGIAWIPILFFFFRNFKERKNPLSLAIGTQVGLAMLYVGPLDYWLTTGSANKHWVFLIFDILSITVCIHFYLAIRWSRRKFNDTRRSPG